MQNEILVELYQSEQMKMNEEKIKLMLSREENYLNKQKSNKLKNIKNESVNSIVGVGKHKCVKEVLNNLDYLSDNIVKYLNLPKILKKNYKK